LTATVTRRSRATGPRQGEEEGMMRAVCVTLLIVALLAGWPARAGARDAGREAALGGASVAANLLYTPAKLVMALLGLPAGALTFVCTGGNARAAYAIWVPTIGGTYFITPARLEGVEPIKFIGSHYPASMAAVIDEETTSKRDGRCAHAKHHADCHQCPK